MHVTCLTLVRRVGAEGVIRVGPLAAAEGSPKECFNNVKTRFTDVLVGQTLVVSALAPLYSRDPMILCVATAFSLLYQLLQLVIH